MANPTETRGNPADSLAFSGARGGPPALQLDALQVRYGDVTVVDQVSFALGQGELLVLLGQSGSGKTTTLRAIAGFEPVAGGCIRVGDRVVAGGGRPVPPEQRGLGFVFQDYALFAHLSVAGNVAFGLRHLPPPARAERVRAVLELVDLAALADRAPHTLSGGQQQRVALARALAPRPAALLMDEPFGNLDAALRAAVRAEVLAGLRREGTSVLLVTHDQDEALAIADRVAVMCRGRLARLGTPEEVFDDPRTAEVARFVGQVNLLPATAGGEQAVCVLGAVPLRVAAQGPVLLCIRPHQLVVRPGGPGRVVRRTFAGPDVHLHITLGDEVLHARTPARDAPLLGAAVGLEVEAPLATVTA